DLELAARTHLDTAPGSGDHALRAGVGDEAAVDAANHRLRTLLYDGRAKTYSTGLDMEPLEVLRDIIRDQQFTSVGGPQVAKVYQHLNVEFFGVLWDGQATVAGRSLLSYERAWIPALDPDRL